MHNTKLFLHKNLHRMEVIGMLAQSSYKKAKQKTKQTNKETKKNFKKSCQSALSDDQERKRQFGIKFLCLFA